MYEQLRDILLDRFTYCCDTGILRYRVSIGKVRAGDVAGTLLTNGYLRVFINNKTYYVHRLIFLYQHGFMPRELDHSNGIKTDNRITNLRLCTRQGNEGNKKLKSNNTTGYKGVFRSRDKWVAKISSIYLGTFDSASDAAREYDRNAIIRYGDFALTNERLGLLK